MNTTALEYRRWEFDLFMLYEIINGKYKLFFSLYDMKYELRRNNKNVKLILTTVSGKVHFFKAQRHVEQVTTVSGIV